MKKIHNFSYKFWKINKTKGHNKHWVYDHDIASSEIQLAFEILKFKIKRNMLILCRRKHIYTHFSPKAYGDGRGASGAIV